MPKPLPDSRGKNTPAAARGIAAVQGLSGRGAIIVLVILAIFLFEIRAILLPFALAGAIAYAATPLIQWATDRSGLPRSLIATGVFLLIVAIVGGMAALGLPSLVRAGMSLVTDLQGSLERSVSQAIGGGNIELFGRSINASQLAKEIADSLRNTFGQIGQFATFAAISLAALVGVIITIVVLAFFLLSGPQIAQGLFWLVPPAHRPFVRRVWAKIDPVLKRYLAGLGIVVVYSTCVAYIGLGLVLDVPYAGALAVMTGVLEIVPLAGPIAAAVIAGLVALGHAPGLSTIIAFALYATMLRLSIDQVILPIVLGRAAHLQPVLVIFCLLAGGVLFGIAGILLAVPVALSVKIVLETIYGEQAGVD
jgi:predicted PurR-regulated permease PerM